MSQAKNLDFYFFTFLKSSATSNLEYCLKLYKALPDGKCLQNCFAVHAFQDPSQAVKVKCTLNNFIADNWSFYKEKFVLEFPFVETIGVGNLSETVIISSDEQMIEFLRSDKSILLYSNAHDVFAMADYYNININIFSHRKTEEKTEEFWTKITPDPTMVKSQSKNFDDMYLYHQMDAHYDLLVKEIQTDELMIEEKDIVEEDKLCEETVNGKEIFERTDTFKCNNCNLEFQTENQLKVHTPSHHENVGRLSCDICKQVFSQQSDLSDHIKATHNENLSDGQCNCLNCPFQSGTVLELINHLKITGRSPSLQKVFTEDVQDVRECYTCKLRFIGYINLMNHRKFSHPSNKKCRTFPGTCKFGERCWYVHENLEEKQDVSSVKCTLCVYTFADRKCLNESSAQAVK